MEKFEEQNPQMIVQMTDNLYIKGTIKNKEEFLYDLGTGYYSKLTSGQIKNQF